MRLVLVLLALSISAVTPALHANDKGKTVSAEKQTICLGRFLVNVPKDAFVVANSSKYRWDSVSVTRASQEKFAQFISEKEKKLRTIRHEREASLLKHFHRTSDGTSAVMVFWQTPETAHVYETEAYKWIRGHQFLIKGDASQDKVATALELANRTLSELHFRHNGEIPTGPGFCIDNGYFLGEPASPHLEETFVHFRFKSNPDVMVTISTETNGEQLNDGLLARTENRFIPDAYKELAKGVKTLRRGRHQVGNIQGEETLDSVPGGETYAVHMFYWEATGKPRDLYAPSIVINLETGETLNAEKRRPSLTDQQAIELFDSIVNSIRIRPIARQSP